MASLLTNKTTLTILAAALLLALWVISGPLTRDGPELPQRTPPEPMTVAVVESEAAAVERRLSLQGEVEPDQLVIVRAETAGRVEALAVDAGQAVRSGEVIARLSMDDREARLRRAEAAVRGRESDHRAAEQLATQGFQAQLRVESALADLEAARADLEAVRLEIANTQVRAPIDGILNRRLVEVGDYLAVGGAVAEVLENDPLIAVVQVPQHSIHRVRPGGPARVVFLDGEPKQGVVHHISARADTATRTFRVEIRVPNPDRSLPAGISTRVEIPVETVSAHRISPALVALDDQGRLGIKAVGGDARVVFHAIEVVRAEVDGIWVTGLPERVRLITVGQGFVNAGEPVRVAVDGAGESGPSP